MTRRPRKERIIPGRDGEPARVYCQCIGCDSEEYHAPDLLEFYTDGWRWRLTPHRRPNGRICIQAWGPFESFPPHPESSAP